MQRDDRKAKQAWKLQQRETARAAFPLPDDDIAALFKNVEDELATKGCNHSLSATRKWLAARGHDADKVVAWLEENGGYCDCEVAANARDHWEQNRHSSSAGMDKVLQDWLFDQPSIAAAVSDASVVDESAPILLVVHYSEDDSWGFFSGKPFTIDRGRVIGMGEALRMDPTLSTVVDLPSGWSATRVQVGKAWTRKQDPDV